MSSQYEERDQEIGVSREHSSSGMPKPGDISAIGRFAEELRHDDKDVVAKAETALVKLLPRLKSGDAELLNAEQRECLYGILQVGNISGKSDLLVVVLDALKQIGDVNALPVVKAIASRPVDSSSVRRVKTAAERCLQTLSEIHTLLDPHESLLRPSEAALDSTDTLLRPIADSGSPDTLVRSATWRPDDHPEELPRVEESEELQS